MTYFLGGFEGMTEQGWTIPWDLRRRVRTAENPDGGEVPFDGPDLRCTCEWEKTPTKTMALKFGVA